IPDQSVRFSFVKLVHDLTDALLRLPRLIHIIVEIGDVMAWFIAMGILADQSRNVGLLAAGGSAFGGEHLIESAGKVCLAAHESDQTVNVLRHEKAVLPGVSFGETKGDFARIERAIPTRIVTRSHKT